MVALALAALLLPATAFDLAQRRIPNGLPLLGVLMGLLWHGITSGGPGLVFSLEGIGLAALTLLFWMARALGAGDVKLLGAVGALMGPSFLLWTLLGAILAAGLMALMTALRRGKLTGQLPLAPAIALGAAFALLKLHLRLAW